MGRDLGSRNGQLVQRLENIQAVVYTGDHGSESNSGSLEVD